MVVGVRLLTTLQPDRRRSQYAVGRYVQRTQIAVETFQEFRLIPKHLAGPGVPNCERSVHYGTGVIKVVGNKIRGASCRHDTGFSCLLGAEGMVEQQQRPGGAYAIGRTWRQTCRWLFGWLLIISSLLLFPDSEI